MSTSLQSTAEVPGFMKAALAVLSLGTLGTMWYILNSDRRALLILLAGAAIVLVLVILYHLLLRWAKRRKAAPLERAILDNSAATPNAISQPARRAALDDLRKRFEDGVTKFKAAGKDLYTLPWYVLV